MLRVHPLCPFVVHSFICDYMENQQLFWQKNFLCLILIDFGAPVSCQYILKPLDLLLVVNICWILTLVTSYFSKCNLQTKPPLYLPCTSLMLVLNSLGRMGFSMQSTWVKLVHLLIVFWIQKNKIKLNKKNPSPLKPLEVMSSVVSGQFCDLRCNGWFTIC